MFRKFIQLYRKNEEAWRPFLDDKGKGQPPMEYLVAIEEGTREFASCVHCMGTRPLRSRSHWRDKVGRWRKREPYVALMRLLLEFSAGYMDTVIMEHAYVLMDSGELHVKLIRVRHFHVTVTALAHVESVSA